MSTTAAVPTNNAALVEWVEEWAAVLTPERVEWCDGSDEQYREQCRRLVESGTLLPLDPVHRPGSFLCRSDPGDVARVEDRTVICCEKPEDAGPTNNWVDPATMRSCSTCTEERCGVGSSTWCPSQVASVADEWEDPAGVPISATVFGGRRTSVVPLVTEAFDWDHGVFLGSIMASETTAAATGAVGRLRRDPFAMLPFCGYHMADYFAHWLELGSATTADRLPRIFYVNWFRRDDDGQFLWPGYGENSRVLAWIFERCAGRTGAVASAIGWHPTQEAIDLDGIDLDDAQKQALFRVDVAEWQDEVLAIREHYATFGDRLPAALGAQLDSLASRLADNQ